MKAIIALGSNLGDRRNYFRQGLEALEALGQILPSPLVMGTPDESGLGPPYLNTVALLITGIEEPQRLLEELLRSELRFGRDRSQGSNAPRALDLDFIAAEGHQGRWTWPTPLDLQNDLGPKLTLELPHPRAAQRNFVMEPWRALSSSFPPALTPPEHRFVP